MSKVKLTPAEAARQMVYDRKEIVDGTNLGDLCEQFGKDAFIEIDWYYDECTVYVVVNREESDEEYNRRIEAILKQKQIDADRKAAKREKEYKEYLRLRKKFEKK